MDKFLLYHTSLKAMIHLYVWFFQLFHDWYMKNVYITNTCVIYFEIMNKTISKKTIKLNNNNLNRNIWHSIYFHHFMMVSQQNFNSVIVQQKCLYIMLYQIFKMYYMQLDQDKFHKESLWFQIKVLLFLFSSHQL